MRERLPVGSGPRSVRALVATGAYDATRGFSKAVNASDVVALNTCQHVPAIEKRREKS